VFKGDSMRYWSGMLNHHETRLHGFDSFQGLPEDFDVYGPYIKGAFDVNGEVPHIEDSRVEFIKESALRFRLVSADYSLNTVFFECVK